MKSATTSIRVWVAVQPDSWSSVTGTVAPAVPAAAPTPPPPAAAGPQSPVSASHVSVAPSATGLPAASTVAAPPVVVAAPPVSMFRSSCRRRRRRHWSTWIRHPSYLPPLRHRSSRHRWSCRRPQLLPWWPRLRSLHRQSSLPRCSQRRPSLHRRRSRHRSVRRHRCGFAVGTLLRPPVPVGHIVGPCRSHACGCAASLARTLVPSGGTSGSCSRRC